MSRPASRKKKIALSAVWRESKDLLFAHRRRLAIGFVLLIISRLAGLVLPASTKFLIDEVIGNGRSELLLWIAVAAGLASIVQASTSFVLTILLSVAGQRAITDLRIRVQQHIGRLPVRYYEENKSGEFISRIINDAEGIRNLVGTGFVQLLGGMVTSSAALVVLLWLNWRLTLVTLVMLCLFGAVIVFGLGRLRPIFRERNKLLAEMTGRLGETLSGIRVVKAYTAEKREERIFANRAHNLLRNIAKSMVGVSAMTSASRLVFGLTGVVMSILGAREVLAGRMTVGDIFMFVVFTGMMITPLVQMSNIATQITEAFAGLDRIREVFSWPTEGDEDADRKPLVDLDGEIRFENVGFAYREGVPILEDVSFHAPAGSTTALVGPSGAGKSTIIALVMAFRSPDSGRITVDGVDLAEVRLRDYRSNLAVVLQDDFLFDGTIGENVAFGRPGASDEDVAEAGRIARCDEFVDGLKEGYATVIGERGVKLSGGQRQRVSIARATLANPKILILDEATSSLDSENEALIQEGFRALKTGRTTFVIAHRLSTIRTADQILVVDGGRIVECGTHAELLAAAGRYRDLYERQHQLEENLFVNPGEDFTEKRQVERSSSHGSGGRGGSIPGVGGRLPRD